MRQHIKLGEIELNQIKWYDNKLYTVLSFTKEALWYENN
jgi:hypothetical protein